MLTKMYLTNFMSFPKRTEFDFTASKYSILNTTNIYNGEILKGALFIGPNASGKSNSLKGITFLIDMIKGEGASFSRFRCRYFDNPFVKLEYEFIFNNKKLIYKIECNVNTNKLSEDLTINDEIILKREGSEGELRIANKIYTDEKLDNDTLFLRTASFNTGRFPQEPTLRALMDYLNNSYCIDGYNQGAHWGKTVTKYAEENGVEKLNSFLKEFKYDFFLEYGSESSGNNVTVNVSSDEKIIFLKRKSFPVPNVFYDESQGNQVFIDMLPNLINIIENPGMIIFDEFGNSLHNKLTEKIIKHFMKYSHNSQFFITSHHTNLISNSVFRPDQINLISFKPSDGSTVMRLSSFKPREAQNMEKMYLGGMFEGLPFYEDI